MAGSPPEAGLSDRTAKCDPRSIMNEVKPRGCVGGGSSGDQQGAARGGPCTVWWRQTTQQGYQEKGEVAAGRDTVHSCDSCPASSPPSKDGCGRLSSKALSISGLPTGSEVDYSEGLHQAHFPRSDQHPVTSASPLTWPGADGPGQDLGKPLGSFLT